MPATNATAGGRKLTEAEKRQAEASDLYLGRVPGLAARYKEDPQTAIARALATQGSDTSPVAAGKWGLAEGLGRVGAGFLGKMASDRQNDRYKAEDTKLSSALNAIQLGKAGGTPEEQIAGALSQPPDNSDGQGMAPPPVNPAAAAAPTPPPQAAAPPVAPPGSAPGVPPPAPAPAPAPAPPPGAPPPPVDPQQAAAVAQAMSGPQPGAPLPNPPQAPALDSRGAAPSVIPAPQSGSLTPPPASRGGGRAARAAAGVSRVGQVSGADIEKMANTFVPNVGVSSRSRTPAHNAEVGGKPNSGHLVDANGVDHGRDFVPPNGVTMAALGRTLKAKFGPGFYVANEGDHVHVSPAMGGGGPAQLSVPDTQVADASVGGSNAGTATDPNQLPVPDLPPEEAAPADIPVRQRVRSERLALARQLLQNKAGLAPDEVGLLSDQYFDKGLDEEQKGREEEYAAQVARDNLRTQSEWQGYEQRRGQRSQSDLSTREEVIKENMARGRGAIGQGYDLDKLAVQHGYTMDEIKEKERLSMAELEAQLAAKRQDALARGDQDRFKVLNSGPVLKELHDTQTAVNAKDTNVGIAGRILDIVNTIDPSGVTNSGWTGAQRSKYSKEISELQGLQNKIVFGDAGGKLGGNFSNTDLGFIQAMNPVGPGTPVPTIRRTANNIIAASKRDSEYGVHLMNVIQDGTRPQFTKDWNDYKEVNPVFDSHGNVRDSGGLTFDKWVAMGKPMPPTRRRGR